VAVGRRERGRDQRMRAPDPAVEQAHRDVVAFADYTAIVSGEVAYENGKTQVYIQPHPIIRHMTFSQTMEALDNVRRSTNMSCESFVEAVAYQQAAIEEKERRAFGVQAMHPIKDKRAPARGSTLHQAWRSEIPPHGLRTAHHPATRLRGGEAR
jgi:hypothetical protein